MRRKPPANGYSLDLTPPRQSFTRQRTHSYDQEVIAKGSAVKMRGLAALSFAGAIRTLRQLLRRACNFVLDAAYTLGRLHPLRIWWIAGPLGAPGPGDA